VSYDYTGLRSTATALVAKFGLDATLTKSAMTGPGYAPTVTTTSHAIKAVRLSDRVKDRSGTLIGDLRTTLYISVGTVPEKGDKVTFAGATSEIDEVKIVSPAGVDIVYQVWLIGSGVGTYTPPSPPISISGFTSGFSSGFA